MTTEERPDPDKILSAIISQEKKNKEGSLKIFFGMSAGVGKTYTMLEDAHERVKEGIDLAVGVIETHGRQETAELLKGLKQIPLKKIQYKNTVFEELDLDAILQRRPQLVLVDELAHTNVPGSRHPKRWQDVIELLDAGIDVYTSLNVQHVESRKDVVEGITGIQIRETVPDLILERATQIELVDITPDELLKRLKEGKVYLGTQSEIAARNFFQEDRLTALREIALRFTAEKVDHDLHEMIALSKRMQNWKTGERLLVGISSSPHSQHLIRSCRRLAFNLDAPWIAVYVDRGIGLSEKEQASLSKNLALARELGAEVITTCDPDVATALQRIARQKNVTQIIIGRAAPWGLRRLFRGRGLLDSLTGESSDIDVHVIRREEVSAEKKEPIHLKFSSKPSAYLGMAAFVLVLTVIGKLLLPIIDYKTVGFIYLLGILILSLFLGRGPVFAAAALSALIWNFYFIPSVGTFRIFYPEDWATFTIYFLTAIITGILTTRIREREQLLRLREERTETLYNIVKEITTAPSTDQLLKRITDRLGSSFKGKCEIILKDLDNRLRFDRQSLIVGDDKEKGVALWVFEQGKEAGWSTDTLPSVKNLYIPLKGYKEIMGVLAYHPEKPRALLVDEINILYTVGQQLANYLERSFTEEKARREDYLHQIEKIHTTILDTVSKGLTQPVSSIQKVAEELQGEKALAENEFGARWIQEFQDSSEKLKRTVENVLVMSNLNTGFFALQKELHHVEDLIRACVEDLKTSLENHVLKIKIADNIPPVSFDFSLMELMLCNILFNAVEYSKPGTSITIDAHIDADNLIISVADEGKGIPSEVLSHIFEKFYSATESESAGVGLGLSISKSIAEVHQGRIEARNLKSGGAEFSVIIPLSHTTKGTKRT